MERHTAFPRRMAMTLALSTVPFLAACYTTFDPDDGSGDAVGDTGGDAGHDTAADTPHDTTIESGDVPVDLTPDECGGGLPYACAAGSFCEVPVGLCDSAVYSGSCVEVTTGDCPTIYMPECGCDGMTYANDCERRRAAVSLAYEGECSTATTCAPWLASCPEGWMCDVPADSCWMDGVMGTCTEIRNDCGYLWDPQCSCDGVTYANECERMAAGAWIDHRGECGDPCGGDADCSADRFCEWPTGSCGSWGTGECTALPSGCMEIWDPVCGCDGITYGNDCERQTARAQLSHRGEC